MKDNQAAEAGRGDARSAGGAAGEGAVRREVGLTVGHSPRIKRSYSACDPIQNQVIPSRCIKPTAR